MKVSLRIDPVVPYQQPDPLHMDRFWIEVVRQLNFESGMLWTPEFDEWLFENHGIRILYESEKYPKMITAYEIDDHWMTLHKLKYANRFYY